jgi:hypothetical protein
MDGHLAILRVNVGTHVQEIVNDAEQAVPLGCEVKRSAAILRWRSASGASKRHSQE